ncbi:MULTISPECIES: D-2-hydroxyacid dehydrogenase [unclassified Mesorhizobium]|uniref:D-2-hydroxyacid dehydrogenase n=1 Tax=unclassified Mesorhizobium TaxID=325217 RepID=UPI0024154292|nr:MULTISPECIES: D-2-hydroxyacid dehydrogenase [unclassified Mesorhizobium]MDG4890114.1 D-2-hydroxyacid dehydrogenase [Mesorhizobium sp. WSM4887]MDG4904256.1 D-2-hydroxyacid dehydrogenase [Mesorhizobium sp. WSM4962]MDG4909283.1 D-2-hydroxyacid dehydrogenase [Mesorhizobium sp. WSM4898]MDG4921907.1 D-2-hydroxyacid dehydrogenase [Mesorhizobium sp. WSM4989]
MAGTKFVYVENKLPEASPYYVGEASVRKALAAKGMRADISVRPECDPDYERLSAADYFIGSGFDPDRIRNYGKRLRFIHCTSAGVEKYMPLDWLPQGANLTNSSGVHADKGGTFGAMAVLMAIEEVPRHAFNQRRSIWDPRLTTGVKDKTALFVGTGALGSAIARKVKPFGVTALGISRSGAANADFDEVWTSDRLDDLLPKADCLVMSCPLTRETRGLISEERLALMKAGASVFNIARSGVMDYKALIAALKEGRIGCAILDVFDQEPLSPDDELWEAPNLMIFPHISCDDHDGYIDRCLSIFAENVRRLEAGEDLLNVVDPIAGY